MDKIKVRRTLYSENFGTEYYESLDKFIALLEEFRGIEKYSDVCFKIECENQYDLDDCFLAGKFYITALEDETDEEYAKRMEQIKKNKEKAFKTKQAVAKRKENEKEKRRKLFDKLKKEFENEN